LLCAHAFAASSLTSRTASSVAGEPSRKRAIRARARPIWSRRPGKEQAQLIQAIELGQRVATAEVTDDLERALTADGALSRLREEIGDGLGYRPYPSWFEDWEPASGRPGSSAGSSPC
jgi:hypothetical protein